MSLADKFNQKTDELKAKAKAALREALDEKDERAHVDRDPASHSAERVRDDEPVSARADDRVSRSAERVRDDEPVSARADDRVSRSTERVRDDEPARNPVGAIPRTGDPGIVDQDAQAPRDSGDLRATKHHPDRVPAQPAAESTAESAAMAGRSDLASHEPRLDSTRHHEPVDHGTQIAHGDSTPSADVTGDDRLFSTRRARDYAERWDTLQLDFVDDPRRAIAQADQLVGEILDELQTLFADQRRHLDRDLDSDRSSTEDLRVALGRYRDFFHRLLSL